MSKGRAAHLHCDFCARPRDAVPLLFSSGRSAVPSWICSDCVDLFHDVAKLHETDPEAAARAVAAIVGAGA